MAVAIPILTEIEAVCREGRGDQLEYRQGDASGVHLLKDETDRLFGSVFVEGDDRGCL